MARILIVLADEQETAFFDAILTNDGHDVQVVHKTDKARNALLSHRFDLVLLGHSLYKRRGYAFANFLFEYDLSLPVILIAPPLFDPDHERHIAIRFKAVFQRPLSGPVILKIVCKYARPQRPQGKILLVTESKDTARYFTQILLQHDYDVIFAKNYTSAMSAVQQIPVNLVIFTMLWRQHVSGLDLANALNIYDPTLPLIRLGPGPRIDMFPWSKVDVIPIKAYWGHCAILELLQQIRQHIR